MSMTVSELEAECNRLQLRVLELKEQGRQTQAQLDANRSALAKLKRKAPTPRVSDHALLRYLERVKGLDVEAVKAEIMTPDTIAAIKAGASAVNVNGCRMPIKGWLHRDRVGQRATAEAEHEEGACHGPRR